MSNVYNFESILDDITEVKQEKGYVYAYPPKRSWVSIDAPINLLLTLGMEVTILVTLVSTYMFHSVRQGGPLKKLSKSSRSKSSK